MDDFMKRFILDGMASSSSKFDQHSMRNAVLEAMHNHEMFNSITRNNSSLDAVFNEKLKGFHIYPTNSFEPVTDYGDSERSKELIWEATNISRLQSAVKTSLLQENIFEAEKHLKNMKDKMDYLLNKYPRIFASYGTWGAVYYNYVGMLYNVKGDINKAKENHIRGLIFECIYLARCINVDNVDMIKQWTKNNLGNLYNYNLINGTNNRIDDFTSVVEFKDLAAIFIDYLLAVIKPVNISRIGIHSYLTYIDNMLKIQYGSQMYKKLFGNKITKTISCIKREYRNLNPKEKHKYYNLLADIFKLNSCDGKIELIVKRYVEG